MERLLVYHNPSCSKSRGALEILADEGVDHDVVEYLRAPPDRAALERIVDTVDVPPAEVVRRGDDRRFAGMGVSAAGYTTRDAGVALVPRQPGLDAAPVDFPGGAAASATPA